MFSETPHRSGGRIDSPRKLASRQKDVKKDEIYRGSAETYGKRWEDISDHSEPTLQWGRSLGSCGKGHFGSIGKLVAGGTQVGKASELKAFSLNWLKLGL